MLMLPKNEAKYIQSLHHKKFRDEHGVFIAEGPKVVGELLKRQPEWIKKVYGTKEWMANAPKNMVEAAKPFFTEVEAFELEKISALQTPQQVLALADRPVFTYQQSNSWMLALDGIQDPGNVGTIIRTAHWFGVEQVVCSMDCADAYSPKVVQAAMGSVFKVNIIYRDLPTFFTSYELPVYGAVLQGKKMEETKPVKGCILIGSEGKGIRPETLPSITQKLTIAGNSDAESLNAAVAAGILMQWACG
jgi:RNA methyltransferase, TrmH family